MNLGFEVSFKFPISLYIPTCFIAFLLPKLSLYMSLNFRLAWSLIIVCIILILMPLIAKWLPNDNGMNITIFKVSILLWVYYSF